MSRGHKAKAGLVLLHGASPSGQGGFPCSHCVGTQADEAINSLETAESCVLQRMRLS